MQNYGNKKPHKTIQEVVMDKFDFMNVVDSILERCESEKEIEQRVYEMTEIIKTQCSLQKVYLGLK